MNRRKIIQALGVLACLCGIALAGSVKLSVSDVTLSGSTAYSDGTNRFFNGYVEGVYVTIAGDSSPTATVSLVTVGGNGAVPSRTILSKTVTSNEYFAIRINPSTTAGAAITANVDARIPLEQDRFKLTVTSPTPSNVLDIGTQIFMR